MINVHRTSSTTVSALTVTVWYALSAVTPHALTDSQPVHHAFATDFNTAEPRFGTRPASSNHATLLTIPAELRLQIYGHIFADTVSLKRRINDQPITIQVDFGPSTALLETCQLIRHEAKKPYAKSLIVWLQYLIEEMLLVIEPLDADGVNLVECSRTLDDLGVVSSAEKSIERELRRYGAW